MPVQTPCLGASTKLYFPKTWCDCEKANLEFDLTIVHIWTFNEGQVTRCEPYIDNATMLAALGG